MTATLGRDSNEVVVAALWARILGTAPDSLDANFFESGGTSLDAARLAGGLRTATGREVPLHAVFDHPTIRQQGAYLRAGSEPGAATRGVLAMKTDGNGVPLVLLPGGGGSLVGLGGFAGPRFDRPVHGLLAPGLAEGEAVATGIDELTAHFVAQLEASTLPRRVHLLGFCGGGVFAHHLAGELRDRGWEIVSVTLLETSLAAPDLTRDEIVSERIKELAVGAGIDPDDPAAASPDAVFGALRDNGVDLVEADTAAFVRRLHVFASLWRAIADYRPEPIDVPVVLFSPPDRLEDAPEGFTGDWCDLGMPRFRQVDVDERTMRLNTHEPTLDAVEAWLVETEGAA